QHGDPFGHFRRSEIIQKGLQRRRQVEQQPAMNLKLTAVSVVSGLDCVVDAGAESRFHQTADQLQAISQLVFRITNAAARNSCEVVQRVGGGVGIEHAALDEGS